MDFITQLPETKDGNDCLFVIVDRFSKFTLIIPCKTSISAPEVASLFFDYFLDFWDFGSFGRIQGFFFALFSDFGKIEDGFHTDFADF